MELYEAVMVFVFLNNSYNLVISYSLLLDCMTSLRGDCLCRSLTRCFVTYVSSQVTL